MDALLISSSGLIYGLLTSFVVSNRKVLIMKGDNLWLGYTFCALLTDATDLQLCCIASFFVGEGSDQFCGVSVFVAAVFWQGRCGRDVRAINRPGSQLLGANGRDDGAIILQKISRLDLRKLLLLLLMLAVETCHGEHLAAVCEDNFGGEGQGASEGAATISDDAGLVSDETCSTLDGRGGCVAGFTTAVFYFFNLNKNARGNKTSN
ncbi:hypothetical protein RYX36_011446 [Vicia faba]